MTNPARDLNSTAWPDPARVARCQQAPEHGPCILFFSGGTAMRGLSRALKVLTHNSVHLITPFDSGGSSAVLRQAFDMLSVGDLRSRLMSLADETVQGNPEIVALFTYRLAMDVEQSILASILAQMTAGAHPLVAALPESTRGSVCLYLRRFRDEMPAEFDLRGASIGNLVLVGGYLEKGRDIDAVIAQFTTLVKAQGTVRPITAANLHLEAELVDGTRVIGQHRITGKETAPITAPIRRLHLVDGLAAPQRASLAVAPDVLAHFGRADLICYPIGSFWSSIVANLLPAGVGRALAASRCPKVYIPNAGDDPEQLGMMVHDCVRVLCRAVRADAGRDVPLPQIIDCVLVDTGRGTGSGADYGGRLDHAALEKLGVPVLDVALTTQSSRAMLAARPLAEILATMAT